MELSIVVLGRVEGRLTLCVEGHYLANCACECSQCGGPARLMLEAETRNKPRYYPLCPEDAIELALELVREAKAAMQEEKKRSVVR